MLDRNDGDMSVSQSLDIVSSWLERVANRDPVLFSQLMKRIKIGATELNSRVSVRRTINRRVKQAESVKERTNA